MPTTEPTTKYQCPGERGFISESVHLARLSAFYPACRECIHRHSTGQIPLKTVEHLKETESRIERDSLLTDEGVRGIYLNELTRERAAAYAAALASLLWRDTPLAARRDLRTPIGAASVRLGPGVVVGFDERPSSPDIAVGVVRALRTMSCRVIDVGQVTRPGFSFAVSHMQAGAGIYVTGAGCAPVCSGLDFEHRGAVPISAGAALTAIEQLAQRPNPRPSRQAGQLRAFHAAIPYEASLWKHFHALRPLKVVCGCSSELVSDLLSRIFEKLPGEIFLTKLPVRQRNLPRAADADVAILADEVRLHRGHLGLLIDDDCQTCYALDERGELIDPLTVTRLLLRFAQLQHPSEPVAVASTMAETFPEAIDGGATAESMSRSMTAENATFGGGESGRYWFRESVPVCDAILTLARLLQLLSRSDADFSLVVETAERNAIEVKAV